MRVVVQRVSHASVAAGGETVSAIGRGMLVFVGVAPGDDEVTVARLARKVAALRIFDDGEGRMNLAAVAADAEALCVSQFTLLADLRRGNRPSFTGAAAPAEAEPLFEAFAAALEGEGVPVHRGVFGASMAVELVNDGPVTIVLDSAELERSRRS